MRRTVKQKIELINEIFNEEHLFKCGEDYYKRAKVIPIRDTAWTNMVIKRSETVRNIYTLALPSSGYAILINEISVAGIYKDEKLNFKLSFVKKYWHTNISESSDIMLFLKEGLEIRITFQNFCNPVSPIHLLEDFGSDVLLATNLETQNIDDSFCDVSSVSNSETDYPVSNLRAGSSYIELLTGFDGFSLERMEASKLNSLLNPIISTTPEECWAKAKSNNAYQKVLISAYDSHKNNFSNYYPVISYEEIQALKLERLTVEYDFGCFGLGSAGTAILDLIARCNYFKSMFLLDYDSVETKNLRNQWYTQADISLSKCASTLRKIKAITCNKISPVTQDSRIEEALKNNSFKFKYVVSGFDNFEAREYLYNKIIDGTVETDYLIDCRYLDLSSSIYFIKTSDKSQMEYYYKQLQTDKKLMENQKPEIIPFTQEELWEYWRDHSLNNRGCSTFRRTKFCSTELCVHSCGSDLCKAFLYSEYLKNFENHKLGSTETSCVRQNFIDIYKYTGAIVMGGIRAIENKKAKPFTHIEAETDVDGLPALMKVRG